MTVATSAACAAHPEVAAVVPCRRCGLFLCEQCVELRGEDSYCRACSERRDRPAPRNVKLALYLTAGSVPLVLVLAFVPVVGCVSLPAGAAMYLAGATLTLSERRKLRREAISEASAPLLRWALLFLVVWGATLAAFTAFMIWIAYFARPH